MPQRSDSNRSRGFRPKIENDAAALESTKLPVMSSQSGSTSRSLEDDPGLGESVSLPRGVVDLSIIIPLCNEQENIEPLYKRLCEAMDSWSETCEVLMVDDGSTDDTSRLIHELAGKDSRITAITLRRNFGQTLALLAGIDHSRGRVIVPMDGDLQNDPNDIPRLLEVLDQGYDVVSGWRKSRNDSFFRVWCSRIANVMVSWVTGVRLHDYGCSLKTYRREVIKGVRLYGEMHRYIPVYATWQGARVTEVPVEHHPRTAGQSKYKFDRILKVLLDLIVLKFLTSYFTKPIYVFGGVGLLSMLGSLAAGLLAIGFKLTPVEWGTAWHKDFSTTPLPIISIGLFIVGLQMILSGLLAEITIRTYYESQQQRPYVIKKLQSLRSDGEE